MNDARVIRRPRCSAAKPEALLAGLARWRAVAVSLWLATLSAGAAETVLSPAETQWLAAHPVLRLGVRELPPLVRQREGASGFEGLAIDYAGLIERRLGTRFTLVYFPSWSGLLDAAKNRDVDLLATVAQTRERSGHLDFSPPYYIPLDAAAGASGLGSLTNSYGFASRNDWPELGVILAKALSGISARDHDAIRRRWSGPDTRSSMDDPRAWLAGGLLAGLAVFLLACWRRRIGLFFRGSIRRNLILVVIVSSAPALGIILYAGLEKRKAQIQESNHQAVHLAIQTANWVERLSRQIHHSLLVLAETLGGAGPGEPDLVTAANSLLQSQRILDVFVFNGAGDIVASGRPDLIGKARIANLGVVTTVSHSPVFTVGSSVMSATYGNPMIHFALPIIAGPGAIDYFIGKTVQLDTCGIEFDRTEYPPGATLTITDRNGLLLYRYPADAGAPALGQRIPQSLWHQISGPSGSGATTAPGPDGAPWLLAWRQLALDEAESPDLYLLVSLPQTRPIAGANRLLWRDLLLLAGATLGAVLIAVFLGDRMLLNLLDRIAAAARAVGSGNLSARVGSSAGSKGDLGDLARTFDAMAAGLEHEQSERKRAEEGVRESLREKESLLKEIHHRVKNNLQIISSLLRLQSRKIDNPGVKTALQDMQNRVMSMALIHEHLYRSETLATVDLAAYIESLCRQVVHALVAQPGAIALHLDLAPASLGIDQAIPCGLLVNELLSNAIKHAFPGGRSGEIWVGLQPVPGSAALRLSVADNGAGLPPDFSLERLPTLGLQLASKLACQMGGELSIRPGASAPTAPGALFEVVFTIRDD